MKNVMHTSLVASAPCARKLGSNTKNPSATSAPALPNNRCVQQNTSTPVATLNSAINARPAISRGK